jgi:response regulator RpfG family c-di-GMP phosphodiesterase
MSTADAEDYLHKHAGSQFDPICVEAFFERLENITSIQKSFSDS